jgi:hypothetical protein
MYTLQAAHKEAPGIVPQLGILQHVADLKGALLRRWKGRAWSPFPTTVFAQWESVVARKRVLIVAEGRSGSTLLGELAFDTRPGDQPVCMVSEPIAVTAADDDLVALTEFIYMFEPCRLREGWKNPDGAGRFCAYLDPTVWPHGHCEACIQSSSYFVHHPAVRI